MSDHRVALARAEGEVSYGGEGSPAGQFMGQTSEVGRLFDEVLLGLALGSLGNPLGEVIRRGDSVVLKPNWVMHHNVSGEGIDCLVTHAAIVGAALERVLKASPGKVIIGDAPVQGCDLDGLLSTAGYSNLRKWCASRASSVQWLDFRRTTLDRSKPIWSRSTDRRDEAHFVLFDLGKESLLEPISDQSERFRVTVYNPDLMRERHTRGKHQYLIAREILEADVVLNLPKLKTHAKAGLTGALKNLVGINGNKEFLPHHRTFGKSRGGDCYEGGSRLKQAGELLLDAANRRDGAGNLAYRGLSRLSFRLARSFGEDRNMEGSWHGNDTIWRTCLDLNRILFYGRLDGTLAEAPQRRVVTITDAIIAGEGNGPLAPRPRQLGALTCATNPVAADFVHAFLMGLDWRKIPLVREGFGSFSHSLADFNPDEVEVITASGAFKQPWPEWNPEPFVPPDGWIGHCERAGHRKEAPP